MQTFLPYPDFQLSVETLDYRRLGKQRVEAKQILSALAGETRGWRNHPAVLMWTGYEVALAQYMRCCIEEWLRRGYRNTMVIPREVKDFPYPWWWGMDKVHAGYRSNLLRKDWNYYSQFGWTEGQELEYYWPTRH